MLNFLNGYAEAGKCKTCSAVFLRFKERIDKYDDFDEFYKDLLKDTKNESSDKVLAYVLSVLFVVYKSEKLDDNLSMYNGLSYGEKKTVEDLILYIKEGKKKRR